MVLVEYDLELYKLAIKKIVEIEAKPCIIGSDDINGDGYREYLIRTEKPDKIWITDHTLTPLAWINISALHLKNALQVLNQSNNQQRHYAVMSGDKFLHLVINVQDVFPKSTHTLPLFPVLISIIIITVLFSLLYFKQPLHLVSLFNKLYSSDRIGCLLLSSNSQVLFVNKTFLTFAGTPDANTAGKTIYQLLSHTEFITVLQHYDDYIQNNYIQYAPEETINTHDNSNQYALEMQFISIKQKHYTQILVIDLKNDNQAERIKLWGAMAQRVAHKIKTPLATILLAIQRLEREYHKSDTQNAEKYDVLTHAAIEEIERVRKNINSFMKFAKLEEPLFQIMAFKPALVRFLKEYELRIPETVHVKTELDEIPVQIKLDEDQFKEAFYNILDNSINAMQSSGNILITLTLVSHPLNEFGGKDMILLQIIDNGRGISAENLKNIFKPGYTTCEHGSGMGLTISKSVFEHHGGTLKINSKEEIGTTTSIYLPVQTNGD